MVVLPVSAAGQFNDAALLRSAIAYGETTGERYAAPMLAVQLAAPAKKSPFLGVLYSALLPGMGELYAGRFDRGIYPLIAEGALWLGVGGFSALGSWTRRDSRLFAEQFAGVNSAGKDDAYFSDIGNYQSVEEYNAAKLVERNLGALYPEDPAAGYSWKWRSDEDRRSYRDQRIRADELSNTVSFFVLGLIANRIWSAVESAIFVRKYNSELDQADSKPVRIRSELVSGFGRIDGFRFILAREF